MKCYSPPTRTVHRNLVGTCLCLSMMALARVVIGGLATSTLVTHVFTPVVYVTADPLLEKVRERQGARWSNEKKAIQPAKS